MLRSLRGRLIVLLILLVGPAIATGALMVGLFRQSATAQAEQAEAEIGRACDAIAGAYRFHSAGWQGPALAAAFALGAVLIFAVGKLSRNLLDAGSVHAFNPPAP